MKLLDILIALSMLLGFTAARGQMGNGSYYDLGISLSGGYGTISAHMLPRHSRGSTIHSSKFPNRRNPLFEMTANHYIDIAKIEGGETYKNYMLGRQNETHFAAAPKFCPFSEGVCRYWRIQTLQPVNPIASMLRALITAAEATLETSVNSVAATAYDTKITDYNTTKLLVTSALDRLGVASHSFLGHSAVEAAKSLGRWEFPSVVLSVDFARDSLSSSLWTEGLQQRDWTHSTNLRHASLEQSRGSNDTLRFEKDFKAALNFVCANSRRPTRDIPGVVLSEQKGLGAWVDQESVGGKAVYDHLDAVLLLGEHANNQEMQIWLREVVTSQFANGDEVDFTLAQVISPDSTFVGSRGAAWGEYNAEQVVWRQRCREVCDWREKWGLGCDTRCRYTPYWW